MSKQKSKQTNYHICSLKRQLKTIEFRILLNRFIAKNEATRGYSQLRHNLNSLASFFKTNEAKYRMRLLPIKQLNHFTQRTICENIGVMIIKDEHAARKTSKKNVICIQFITVRTLFLCDEMT